MQTMDDDDFILVEGCAIEPAEVTLPDGTTLRGVALTFRVAGAPDGVALPSAVLTGSPHVLREFFECGLRVLKQSGECG